MANRQTPSTFPRQPSNAAPLCFVVDEDFGLRRDLSKELRRQAIDVVEFSNSARLSGAVDDQDPDIVLINVVGTPIEMGLELLPASTGIQAKLCRPELLVEIEAIAMFRTPKQEE